MWLVGVVVRRYIDILIIIINFPYSTCIRSFLGSSILTSLLILKKFFRSLLYSVFRCFQSKYSNIYLRQIPPRVYTLVLFIINLCIIIIIISRSLHMRHARNRLNAHSYTFSRIGSMRIQCGRNQCAFDVHGQALIKSFKQCFLPCCCWRDKFSIIIIMYTGIYTSF